MAKEINIDDPLIPEILSAYIERCMAELGPYVSCVFFILLFGFAQKRKAGRGYVKTVHVSIDEIAQKSGMSRRKAFDAIKALKDQWIVVQFKRRGRGYKSRYYFLPVTRWAMPRGAERA